MVRAVPWRLQMLPIGVAFDGSHCPHHSGVVHGSRCAAVELRRCISSSPLFSLPLLE